MKSARRNQSLAENPAPRFTPRGVKQHHWGNDGTIGRPDSIRLLLQYNMVTTATTTLGSLFSYQFRGNSVFDPDLTGAGSQPNYFDNYANMYNSYVVLSSRIRIEVINLAASSPVQVVVFPAYNTSLPSSANDAAGNTYAIAKSVMGTGNAVKAVLQSTMSTAQIFGVRPQAVLDDSDYEALTTTNPSSAATWYWTICAQVEQGTTTLNLQFRVSLLYDVKFFDPSVVNLSATRGLVAPTPSAPIPPPMVLSAALAAAAGSSDSTHDDSLRACCACTKCFINR